MARKRYTREEVLEILFDDKQKNFRKGKLSFKQYIPQKRARFGVKLFTLCEDTGYCWNSFVYMGRNTQLTDEEDKMVRSIGKSGLVVIQLIKDLFGTGRKLFVDNFYSSENLFRLLEKNNIAACRTLRKGRVKLPKSFTRKKLAKGESDFTRNGNLIVVRFHDKKVIKLISMFHRAKFVYLGKLNYNQEPVIKLAVIHDYNQHMGGVDQNDAQLVHYSPVRKSQKWTTKFFLHFLDEAVFNSHVVYKKSGGTKSFLEFKLLITDNLLRKAEVDIEEKHTRKGNHYPELIPANEKKRETPKAMLFML